MAVPDIILEKPFILVTLSQSALGIQVEQAFGFEFGTVEAKYETCDRVDVGQSVLFQPDKGVKLVYGSTIYFMIEDGNTAFSEVIPP